MAASTSTWAALLRTRSDSKGWTLARLNRSCRGGSTSRTFAALELQPDLRQSEAPGPQFAAPAPAAQHLQLSRARLAGRFPTIRRVGAAAAASPVAASWFGGHAIALAVYMVNWLILGKVMPAGVPEREMIDKVRTPGLAKAFLVGALLELLVVYVLPWPAMALEGRWRLGITLFSPCMAMTAINIWLEVMIPWSPRDLAGGSSSRPCTPTRAPPASGGSSPTARCCLGSGCTRPQVEAPSRGFPRSRSSARSSTSASSSFSPRSSRRACRCGQTKRGS
mmetsp:Transcript_51754/g.168208  ORF Transcript_51754/g.168208 Transcript_51754/m.168208 type:complete len:279 (-) Transcript_51754:73-909(-)